MVRMSCLLGSPMVTTEARSRRPGQPGRAKQGRLPPPGDRQRPRGGAERDGQAPPLRPRPAHNRSSRAALFSRPRSAAPWLRPLEPRPGAARACAGAKGAFLPSAVRSRLREGKRGAG